MKTLVVGELNIDLIVSGLTQLPVLGQEIICTNVTKVLGSSSAIFASHLAGLGSTVDFIGVVGDDNNGRFVLEKLEQKGVGTAEIIVRNGIGTGIGISLSLPEDRAIITYLGSIAELTIDDINLGILSQYEHLHVASYFLQRRLQPGLKTLFRTAQQEGLTVSFDTGWDPNAAWDDELVDLLDHVDIFLPNEPEACALTRQASVQVATQALSELVSVVVVKLGSEGAIGQTMGGQRIHVPAYKVEVLDTTGAGDSFNAGFIYAYRVRGQSLADALQFANVCGALAVQSVGGATSLITMDRIRSFTGTSHTDNTIM